MGMSVLETFSVHPAAEIFPLIEGHAFDELVSDIRSNGLREAITVDTDGRVLDGRNRLRACQVAGVEPTFRTWDGQGSPVSYVVSLNLHRRHLDTSQRAMVFARIATLEPGRPDENTANAVITQSQAAEILNVSVDSGQRAKQVLAEGTPELVRAVDQGRIAVSTASEATTLEPEQQREVVQRVEAGERPAEVIKDYKPHVSNNSGNNEWYTPPDLIAAARKAMGSIHLDPASSEVANRTVKAERFYTAEQDGLRQPWSGNVWMNPPYSQPLVAQFSEAVSEKFDTKQIKRACVLVNNATETAWFQRMLASSAAVAFLKSRVRFIDPTGKPTGQPLQGQAVLYLGDDPWRFASAFGELGVVLYKDDGR